MSPLNKVRQALNTQSLNYLLVTHLTHIRYLCGFTGSNALLLISPHEAVFITDGRYTEQAKKEVRDCRLELAAFSNQLYDTLRATAGFSPQTRVGFESGYTTVAALEQLRSLFPDVQWTPVSQIIEPIRMVKTDEELRFIREAVAITEKAFQEVLPQIRPGMTEMHLAALINYHLRLNGAQKEAFDTIVASGPNSAMPHARPTAKKIEKGEFIIMDFGAVYGGFHGDMTRTIYLGSPTDEERNHYEAVREAQSRSLKAARSGMTAKSLDSVARDYLKSQSLDAYFTHSLGHGLGLEIHESPIISQTNEQLLPEGLVCTIEPGIYLPGRYGIRIENDVCLRRWGCQDFMTLSTELTVIPA